MKSDFGFDIQDKPTISEVSTMKAAERITDPDYIPWQLGVFFVIIMLSVVGLLMGSVFGAPFKGLAWTLGSYAATVACGLTYDRIKHGRWFVQ